MPNKSAQVVLTLVAQLEGALEDWFVNQAPETLKGRLTKEEFMVRQQLCTIVARTCSECWLLSAACCRHTSLS